MITKEIVVGSIEILEDSVMQVREDIVVIEDGKELSRTYNRYVVVPGEDVSQRPTKVQDIANFLWTSDVIEAWKIKEESLRLPAVGGL
jgi:hypothetical protein